MTWATDRLDILKSGQAAPPRIVETMRKTLSSPAERGGGVQPGAERGGWTEGASPKHQPNCALCRS
jgi:hypothetical protein